MHSRPWSARTGSAQSSRTEQERAAHAPLGSTLSSFCIHVMHNLDSVARGCSGRPASAGTSPAGPRPGLPPHLTRAARRSPRRCSRATQAPPRCARPAAGPGPAGAPGVRESFTGTPSSRTGAAAPGLVELHHHLAGANQLRVERLVEVEHRLEAAVVLRRKRAPLVARALEEDALDLTWASDPGPSNCFSTRSSRPTRDTTPARTSARARRA